MSNRELPPPPSRPQLSPPVLVKGEESVTLLGLSGEPSLEARISASPEADRAVVLCHPHPLYGGTMHSAVIVAIARLLADKGGERVATLRFNYRGVGASEGRYGEGLGEVMDARAALRALAARAPRAKVTMCGYSFGTWVGLRAAAIEGNVERVALVAPAVRIFSFVREDGAKFRAHEGDAEDGTSAADGTPPAPPERGQNQKPRRGQHLGEASASRLAIYLGDEDEFCSVQEARDLADNLGASLRVFPGSDHFFLSSRRKLAEVVVPFLAPEIA
jgi:alpha/beta superfamily hydrolase